MFWILSFGMARKWQVIKCGRTWKTGQYVDDFIPFKCLVYEPQRQSSAVLICLASVAAWMSHSCDLTVKYAHLFKYCVAPDPVVDVVCALVLFVQKLGRVFVNNQTRYGWYGWNRECRTKSTGTHVGNAARKSGHWAAHYQHFLQLFSCFRLGSVDSLSMATFA